MVTFFTFLGASSSAPAPPACHAAVSSSHLALSLLASETYGALSLSLKFFQRRPSSFIMSVGFICGLSRCTWGRCCVTKAMYGVAARLGLLGSFFAFLILRSSRFDSAVITLVLAVVNPIVVPVVSNCSLYLLHSASASAKNAAMVGLLVCCRGAGRRG